MYWEITVFTLKSAELWVNKASCDLSCTVRTEIKEYHTVTFRNCTACINYCRQHKFICNTVCIGIFNCLYRTISVYAFSINHCSISLFYSIPSIISIHCIVTSGYSSDFAHADLFHLIAGFFHKFSSR